MLFVNVLEQYKANAKTLLVFALLLVFVLAFVAVQPVFFSSGSVFLDYNLATADLWQLLPAAAFIALFLAFYSFFISIILFSVRNSLSNLRQQYYLHEMIQRFALKIFIFYLLFCFLLFLLVTGLLFLGVQIELINVIVLLVSIALLFVPQAIVVDEEGLRYAIASNFAFIAKNKRVVLTVLIVGCVMLAALQLVEFAIDQIALIGSLVSLFIALVFILPFIEIMKTYFYMMRFELIKGHEVARRKKPHPLRH